MTAGRPTSLIATCDQWVRCDHDDTAVEGSDGTLTLAWTIAPPPRPAGAGCRARGVATDRLCRVYRLTTDAVERLRVGPTDAGLDYTALGDPVTVIGGIPDVPPPGPDFAAAASATLDPTGIAIDDDDRLYLADVTAGTVSVIDLWSRRLLRVVRVATAAHPARTPVGLACHDGDVFVAVQEPPGVLRMSGSSAPVELTLPAIPAGAEPSRVAVLADGSIVVLVVDAAGDAWLATHGRAPRAVGPASDIVVDRDGNVVVAPCPTGDPTMLRRFAPTPNGWTRVLPLDAAGYDGGGIVVTTSGRIGYFTAPGFRLAAATQVQYATEGSCTTYLLDSGIPRNRWGRVLIEACIPDGTACTVATTTSDDDLAPADHHPPVPAACEQTTAPSPPMVPVLLDPTPVDADQPVHRRTDPVTPWWRATERYDTYEAPVMAPPGRYLWVTVRLTGNERRTPRVTELRVEQTAHTLLRRLPAVFAADDAGGPFLDRYLAMFDGLLHDLDLRSRCRDILVDPHGTPAEALDWLASFLGLVLDDRWAVAARRQLVAEIATLYRRRGTVGALGRYIEIFLAGDRATDPDAATPVPVIIEHFRLRGLGGPLLGGDPALTSRSVLGAGFRVGGQVGAPGSASLDPEDSASSFETHAHRFSVLIPRPLAGEDEAAIRRILDTERPAHTVYGLCTVDAGMRVGDGLHLGISSIVGPTGAFRPAAADASVVGRGTVLGTRRGGVAVEAARIGTTARVG